MQSIWRVLFKLSLLIVLSTSQYPAFSQKAIAAIRGLSKISSDTCLRIDTPLYALSKHHLSILSQIKNLKWSVLDSKLLETKTLPDTVLQYWVRFFVKNNFEKDSILLLKLSEKNQHSQLFEVINDQLLLIGETGYGSRISNLSIAEDYWRIYLPLKKKERQCFYLLIKKYQYSIASQKPTIETFNDAFKQKLIELTIFPTSFKILKLWTAGFYFAVFIYCSLKYFFQRKERSYLFYSLAALFLFLRYSLQVDAILLEVDWLPSINNDFIFLLSFIPQSIFYILFLGEFLKVKESKFVHWFLQFCLLQWCFMVVVMLVHFFWPTLTPVTKILWKYNALPFFILTILLCYHTYAKLNLKHFKFALVGVLVLAVAFAFVMVPRWLDLNGEMPIWYSSLNKRLDIITLAFAIDSVLFLTTLAYRDRQDELERNNLKIKNADNERKILRLQMNPHFIFNCLNSINLYIEQNDSTIASKYLSKFSKLMRLSLVHSRKEKILLSEEVTVLKLYLELETMRFKGKLTYAFTIDEAVDLDFIEIPPMLIQPHLENAIWHGLMHKQDGGKININISQVLEKQLLIVKIEDDGIGRAKASELKSKAVEKEKSFGTLITKERIDIFNEKFNTNTTIRIEDLFDKKNQPTGTLVYLKIQLK